MTKKSQIEKFRDKARETEADDDAEKFDAALRRMAKSDPKAIDDMAEIIGQSEKKPKG